MPETLEQIFLDVFRQVLLENSDIVKIADHSYPVTKTKSKKLRQVAFQLNGETILAIEQNPNTKSTWAKLARTGRSVMQFMSGRKYLGAIVDGKRTLYSRKKS